MRPGPAPSPRHRRRDLPHAELVGLVDQVVTESDRHGAEGLDDPPEAMEYLTLASLLMRRLDVAEEKLSSE
jgi:hypothetical protein